MNASFGLRKYFVNKDEVSKEEIEAYLLAQVEGKDEPGVILRAEKSVPIENVVVIMDIANRNKLKLVLATTPK